MRRDELTDKKVIALIAYLDKLGRDISQPAPAALPSRRHDAANRPTNPGQLKPKPMTREHGNPAIDRRSPADGLDDRGAGRPLRRSSPGPSCGRASSIEADAQLWKDDEN